MPSLKDIAKQFEQYFKKDKQDIKNIIESNYNMYCNNNNKLLNSIKSII